MKRYLFLAAACLSLALTACSDDNTKPNQPTNTAPICKITNLTDGQSFDAELPLLIKCHVDDEEDNISVVKLTVGNETISDGLEIPFFNRTVAPEKLQQGPLTITLYVEDTEGLSAQHQVTINLEKDTKLMEGAGGEDVLSAGYWSKESEVHVLTSKAWTLTFPDGGLIEFYDAATQKWAKKATLTGEGNTTLKLKVAANSLFTDRQIALKISTAGETGKLIIEQEASPDMLQLIEDEMLRMAAGISVVMYEIDKDEDGRISAYEAEIEPAEHVAYGFDAGAWDVASTKGIENFPHLRHLDVNLTDKLTEIDLSKNTELMSIHVENCNNLKTLDISCLPNLMELGCNYDLFLTMRPQVDKLKKTMHTLGIFNRKTDEPSALDLSGYTGLSRLHVNDNGLTELNLAGCKSLWKLVAGGNAIEEIDLSDVDRDPDNSYMLDKNPNLKRIYVWQGFTPDYYYIFSYDKDQNIQFIEK